jgi:hypothetical protein
LSHAAGTGRPMPAALVRLMLALKLASLARAASGVRLETIHLLQSLLDKNLTPEIPEQGSVGASGDLAPLAHMAAAMIGVGFICGAEGRLPAAEALARAGLEPLSLGPKEGLALLMRWPAYSKPNCCFVQPSSPAPCPPMPRADRIRRSIAASMHCGRIRARSKPPRRCATCSGAAPFAPRIWSMTTECRTPIVCVASRR